MLPRLAFLESERRSGILEGGQFARVLLEMKRGGMSARQMAAELTARHIPAMNGGKWHAQTVLRAIERIGC
jgi:hypothetical protein